MPERETKIVRLDNLDYREQLERGRYNALLEIRRIYGQKIETLSSDRALHTIKEVNALLQEEPYRVKNTAGQAWRAGGDIRKTDSRL